MSNKHSLQMLTGTNAKITSATGDEAKLWKGQPIYNLDKMYLTVGTADNNNNSKITALPITVRELVGYPADAAAITSSTANPYSIKYNGVDSNSSLEITSPYNIKLIHGGNNAVSTSKLNVSSSLKIGPSGSQGELTATGSSTFKSITLKPVNTSEYTDLNLYSGYGQNGVVRIGKGPDKDVWITHTSNDSFFGTGPLIDSKTNNLGLQAADRVKIKGGTSIESTSPYLELKAEGGTNFMRLYKAYTSTTSTMYITSGDNIEFTAYGNGDSSSYDGTISFYGKLMLNGRRELPQQLYMHLACFDYDDTATNGSVTILWVDNSPTYTSGTLAYQQGFVIDGMYNTSYSILGGNCTQVGADGVWTITYRDASNDLVETTIGEAALGRSYIKYYHTMIY